LQYLHEIPPFIKGGRHDNGAGQTNAMNAFVNRFSPEWVIVYAEDFLIFDHDSIPVPVDQAHMAVIRHFPATGFANPVLGEQDVMVGLR